MKTLPDWSQCSIKRYENKSLNPLEIFIYDNEPAGEGSEFWREQLVEALNFEKLDNEKYHI